MNRYPERQVRLCWEMGRSSRTTKVPYLPPYLRKKKKVIGNEHVRIRIYTGKSRNSTYEQPRRIFLNFSDLCPPCLSAVESI